MANNPEIQRRIDLLQARLEKAIANYNRLSKANYWITVLLMVITLLASAGAGIGGIFGKLTAQQTGALALIPGIIALVVSTMKFQDKAHWHYRKRDALEGLRSRLLFQLPESPSADNIAAIAAGQDDLNKTMSDEWERRFTMDFGLLAKRRTE
jgi:hypothetical protein